MTAKSMRPFLHVTPLQGRLNDPNGLCIVGNTLHIFYQHDPVFPSTPKRTGWGHASVLISGKNAWRITHHPDSLYPGHSYDMQGCYSGNAVIVNENERNGKDNKDSLAIFYTGNVKIPLEDGKIRRRTTQNLVRATNDPVVGMEFHYYPENPLIDGPAPGFTEHFRDPMVTRDFGGERRWRMVIGAQRNDLTGGIALYRSDDLVHWAYESELIFDVKNAQPGSAPDILPRGYMWECPNLFRMHDRSTGEDLDVLVMCPQGLSERRINGVRHYASSDQCGYIVGRLEGATFSVIRGFSELDYGHTFYAPQFTDGSRIANPQDVSKKDNKETEPGTEDYLKDQDHLVDNSRSAENSYWRRRSGQGSGVWDSAVMLGWMGLPDADDAPTVSAAGWVHSLTMPRRVVLQDYRLVQSFLPDKGTIRSCAAEAAKVENYGLFWVQHREVASPSGSDVVHSVLLTDTGGSQAAQVDVEPGRISVEINGDVRVADIDTEYMQRPTSIIVDGCTLEVLAGGGQIAFSSMVYPSAGETWCELREETSAM